METNVNRMGGTMAKCRCGKTTFNSYTAAEEVIRKQVKKRRFTPRPPKTRLIPKRRHVETCGKNKGWHIISETRSEVIGKKILNWKKNTSSLS